MLHGITVREQYNKNSFLGKDILYRDTSFFNYYTIVRYKIVK